MKVAQADSVESTFTSPLTGQEVLLDITDFTGKMTPGIYALQIDIRRRRICDGGSSRWRRHRSDNGKRAMESAGRADDYTVTCEIDDTPTEVEEPDTGTRDDDAITRIVKVRVVKTTKLIVTCIDGQNGDPDAIAGLDINTASSEKATFLVSLNGAAPQNTGFSPSVVDPSGIAGDAIDLLLDHDFKVGSHFHYVLTMTVDSGGIMDKVGNEFDADGDPSNGIQHTTTFDFHLEENDEGIHVVFE